MKINILTALIFGMLLISGCAKTEAPSTSESQAEFERYIKIYSNYTENPSVGDTINFPFKIEAKQGDFIGDSGSLNFYLGGGASVDNSTIDFVLKEQPAEFEVPVTIEQGDDRIFIYLRGKINHKGEEIPFGYSFMIIPSGFNPSQSNIGGVVEEK